jgi:long-chain acyl-CoA synthetase
MECDAVSGVVLLTGANGFIGTQIARRLLIDTDYTIISLVRAKNRETATFRLCRTWWDWPDLASSIGERVKVIVGDISKSRLGLDKDDYKNLIHTTTHIIHAAADIRLNASINELRKTNVQGTANLLELAYAIHQDHGLARLSHISTAYVAGCRSGIISEESLTDEYGFSSTYELSKYEGERLVQAAKANLPISIFRPGMVIGDSRTGAIKTFNTIYFLMRLYLNGRLRFIPASPSLKVNLVPVDYVANAVTKLTFEPDAEGLTFHLTAPWEKLPTARELLDYVRNWAREHLGMRLPHALFIPIPISVIRSLYQVQKAFNRSNKRFLDTLISLAPYFGEHRRFQCDNVNRLLSSYNLRWREILSVMLEFAVYQGFLHRADRTVHEQILFRLRSRSMPVTYHDVIDGKIMTRNTERIRRDILAAVEALRSMGIKKSDRIALVGLNSTHYLIVDVAIGLVGAASVPLYYTSPPSEINEILVKSDSKILFIGSPQILKRLDELKTEIPVVSFYRRKLEDIPARKAITWEKFLTMGEYVEEPTSASVAFNDLATVRYTSGTTGQAKGVCFNHENLRWMAESISSLFPWKTRNNEITYLSFLPMNHVVEGIIASYSPYYEPAPLKIYFLEDFHDLQHTLPKVRPTVFFSVPRFYQKVWEGVLKTKFGRSYINAGVIKRRFLRRILRRAILKKAGLDRCAQLIVGSAPSSEELLRNFQELHIEVNNAYGLTEAPLVTMNRLGANRVATVGEPLPNTELRIANDGEVMVKGPQVTRGYLDTGIEQPFRDGWLLTGDLGYITREGSLVLHGRKKELIVTSYGKNIHPVKIESMLKEIQYVNEAIVLGDGRPFCAAILWVEQKNTDNGLVASIERGIKDVNNKLSHPEQMKRWAILKYDLSIVRGDLTPNLKIKRKEVMSRLSDVVEALYGSKTPVSENVIHISEMSE